MREDVDHRPWPLPRRPWALYQSWRELLFAHWPVDEDHLQELVPEPLEPDTLDGRGWIGLAAFRLTGFHVRSVPVVGASEFLEVNLRTYVTVDGEPGVHFFSLDAGSHLAVWAARVSYRLPYRKASMAMEVADGWLSYRCERHGGEASFAGRYRPIDRVFRPEPGTLEHFLTERYALYTTTDDGATLRADIHHRPWCLQHAEAEIETNTIPHAAGVELPDEAPLLHFAARQDALVWLPRKVAAAPQVDAEEDAEAADEEAGEDPTPGPTL